MDLDGIDVDNLTNEEILKLYNDTLENEDMRIGVYCFCSGYGVQYCTYGAGGYPLYVGYNCK